MCESLREFTWLWRGVPAESDEVADVQNCGEVNPPEPTRTGELWRRHHIRGMTETGYTSWTTERSIATSAAGDYEELTGQIVIFRVRVSMLDLDRVYEGRDDEEEYLIEGTVEGVTISENPADEEDE